MTIADIYVQFEIPPNLQEHMLRVGALLEIMTENWHGSKFDQSALLQAGLCHDLANILKFDFNKPSMLGTEAKRIEYWQEVQSRIKHKYGTDIHQATISMAHESGLKPESIRIIEALDWDQTNLVINKQDWPVMLAIYADMRIGPEKILSLTERIDNLHHRRPMNNYSTVLQTAKKLEKILQSKISINLDQISETDLLLRFDHLKLIELKVTVSPPPLSPPPNIR